MIGKNSNLRQTLLQYFHETLVGGHLGVQATYQRIAAIFLLKGNVESSQGIYKDMQCVPKIQT